MNNKSVSLKVQNVTKTFAIPGGSKVVAVNDCSFTAAPGEFVTLLGPSGCGKTTLLRLIAGFETPDKGQIFLNDASINHYSPQNRDMAMVFQNYALFPHMNVFKNVAYSLSIKKQSRSMIENEVKEALKLVGLEGMESRSTGQLSGGQQQRVALARALVKKPSVLLLDEPLSNLDAKLRIQTRYELKNIQRRLGITTLYVTHDQEEALFLSDKIILMNNGIIEQIGEPAEAYQRPATPFVAKFLGSANFVKGRLIRQDGHESVMEVLGQEVSVRREINKNQSWVMVRPEHIRLVSRNKEDANKENCAIVKRAHYLGIWIETFLEINNQTIVARILAEPGSRVWDVGDVVELQIVQGGIHPISNVTEEMMAAEVASTLL